ncbi:MAG: DUF2628 domain-containing protein [Coriobacteriia bacterium]|nr:DUF2628 domain-containing protein [Coriobacteriia bacterium]
MEIAKLTGTEKVLCFDKGTFSLDGQVIDAAKLAEYDNLGILEWKSDELQLLAYSMIQNTTTNAPAADASNAQSQQQNQGGFSGERDGRIYLNDVDITNEDPYWQEEFIKIYQSKGSYTGKFNWAAFLAGAFWFFAKNLPVVGLIWTAVAIVGGLLTASVLAIGVWILAGFRANYIRYKKVIEHTEIYF